MKKYSVILLLSLLAMSEAKADLDATFFPEINKVNVSVQNKILLNRLPKEALEILKRHSTWQTSAGLSSPGLSSVLSANRKWNFVDSDEGVFLNERTKLSLEQDCSSHKYIKWVSGRINLNDDLDPFSFLDGHSTCTTPKQRSFSIRFLSDDRFLIEPDGTGIAVLFFSSNREFFPSQKPILNPTHIFTSPGAPTSLEGITGIRNQTDHYLHHNLNRTMPVVLDESFPSQHIPALQSSLNEWNEHLGSKFFRLNEKKEKVDIYDCISSRKLCFVWSGLPDISFLGATGATNVIFDPESGEISGGYIGVVGNTSGELTNVPHSDELDRYISETASVVDVARIFLNRETLSHTFHPEPNWQLGYVFSHELGHFNGLSHNFYGSNQGDGAITSDSVMDYLPFSGVNSKSMRLGRLDLEALQLIYKGVTPSEDYIFCGDDNSEDPMAEGVSKDPNCNKFDLGRPDEWFITLAKLTDGGVFSKHPRFNGILLDYLGAFLKPNQFSVSIPQIVNVQKFLCSNTSELSRVRDYLEKIQVSLVCETNAK